jgi:hypothetical protein
MFELRKSFAWIAVGLVTLATGDVVLPILTQSSGPPTLVHGRSRPKQANKGDLGGDLSVLSRYHVKPEFPGESNHYIDLWCGSTLPVLARKNHLTNNHALFVDSHGKAGCGRFGGSYGFYPNQTLLEPGQPIPYFSPGDLARVLGPVEAAKIHNVVLAGCNSEGRFRSSELRRHFLNATNITYMTPGELAFKPMYYQAIVLPTSEIRSLYGKPQRNSEGRMESRICTAPAPGMQALGSYVADLYLPSAKKPYRTVRAGRELLEHRNVSKAEPARAPVPLAPPAATSAPSASSGQAPAKTDSAAVEAPVGDSAPPSIPGGLGDETDKNEMLDGPECLP